MLVKQVLRYVMSDEAGHVAFGVLSLKEYYGELTDAEMLERQEFAFEAAVRMRDRFLQQEVWARMGVDVRTMIKLQLENQGDTNEDPFQQTPRSEARGAGKESDSTCTSMWWPLH